MDQRATLAQAFSQATFATVLPLLSSRIGRGVQKGRLMVGRYLELKTVLLEMRGQIHAKAFINHWSRLAQPAFANLTADTPAVVDNSG